MSSGLCKGGRDPVQEGGHVCVPVWAEECSAENSHHFIQWCGFKVSCSVSWKQQVLSAPCVADVSGNDEFRKGSFFLLTLKVLFLKRHRLHFFTLKDLFGDEYQDSLCPLKKKFYVPDSG